MVMACDGTTCQPVGKMNQDNGWLGGLDWYGRPKTASMAIL